jgi:hypothetical protein
VEEVIALTIPIVGILATASVLILRPITKRLGDTLHQMQQDRRETRLDQGQMDQIRGLVESLQERIELVEQRQGFFESLLEARSERGVVDRGGRQARLVDGSE